MPAPRATSPTSFPRVTSFREAAAQALKAIELDPKDGDAYGVLGDAYLELGRYDRAGEAYDAMMGLKSDIASYGRRSGLRNLRGDSTGAIDDLHRAVASGQATGQPRESIAWAQSQLGAEHVAIGQHQAAEAPYLAALQTYPRLLPRPCRPRPGARRSGATG